MTPGPTTAPDERHVLRIVTGRIHRGSERAFVTHIAQRVTTFLEARPGLLGFVGGYRREPGGDAFALVTVWASERAIAVALDDPGLDTKKTAIQLGGFAVADAVDHYDLLPPEDGGLVDFSGGVIRLSRTALRPDRLEAGYDRLRRSGDDLRREHLLVGQYLGRRIEGDRHEIVTASVWPSLAALEAFTGPRPADDLLFPEMSAFLDEVAIAHYQTIEFGLPQTAARPPRRAIAVRFRDRAAADAATTHLRAALTLRPRDIVVAPLGRTAPRADDGEPAVMVIRVVPGERFEAERLIGDLEGEFLTSLD